MVMFAHMQNKVAVAKNGMFFEDGNYQTWIRCSDDGTLLAYAASHYFHKNWRN